jgi:hypothetical protein
MSLSYSPLSLAGNLHQFSSAIAPQVAHEQKRNLPLLASYVGMMAMMTPFYITTYLGNSVSDRKNRTRIAYEASYCICTFPIWY